MSTTITGKSQFDPITLAILRALSVPPCEVGMRLKSEDDLAVVLKVGRRRIRNSLGALEDKGILIRRRGSGTYLRRIPDSPPDGLDELPPSLRHVTAESLLAANDDSYEPTPAGPTRLQKQLHLKLWGDIHCTTVVNQMILAGMVRRADQLGHRLTVHSLIERRDVPLPVDELAGQLRSNPGDGDLVVDRWSDLFVEAQPDRPGPIIFFASGSVPVRHEPLVMFNSAEAVERGVHILAEAGHQRIGLISLNAAGHFKIVDEEAYERAMVRAGLSYRAVVPSTIDVSGAMAATRQILSLPTPPEAIYVTDDHVLSGVAATLDTKGLVAGRDIAVITQSNADQALPSGCDWSRLEFDPEAFGRRLVDELLLRIQRAGAELPSLAIHASWRPGLTHLRNADTDESPVSASGALQKEVRR